MLGVDKSLRMREDIRLVNIKVLVVTLDALLAPLALPCCHNYHSASDLLVATCKD
jgi:hypothetical protein